MYKFPSYNVNHITSLYNTSIPQPFSGPKYLSLLIDRFGYGPCWIVPLGPKPYLFMRGAKIFKEVAVDDTIARPKRKGRNSDHMHRRNKCLMDRYYYYSNFTDKRYELIIEELSIEFFLSVHTIPDLIQDHMEQLLELKEKKPAITYFSNRWPHIKW